MPRKKLYVVCTCDCGRKIKITKADASRVLRTGAKKPDSELAREYGKKGAEKRWENYYEENM